MSNAGAQDHEHGNKGDRGDVFSMRIGAAESVPFGALKICPDTHICYRKDEHGPSVWVTAAGPGRSWLFRGPSLETLEMVGTKPVLLPGGQHFDRDYVGLSSMVWDHHAKQLLGFLYAEFHPTPTTFDPSIGLATSTDGGHTWNVIGQVIGKRTGGASAVVRKDDDGESIYLYYHYADATRPVGTYVARSPLDRGGQPGTWQHWTGKAWGKPGDQGAGEPVVTPAAGIPTAACAHVSWNGPLKRWLMVYESGFAAFHITTSEDGLHWSPAIEILRLRTDHGWPKKGEIYANFPTLVSPHEPSTESTSAEGFLYYARGLFGGGNTSAWRHPFKIVARQ